jgi:hypothetical protein
MTAHNEVFKPETVHRGVCESQAFSLLVSGEAAWRISGAVVLSYLDMQERVLRAVLIVRCLHLCLHLVNGLKVSPPPSFQIIFPHDEGPAAELYGPTLSHEPLHELA